MQALADFAEDAPSLRTRAILVLEELTGPNSPARKSRDLKLLRELRRAGVEVRA